MVDQLPAQSDAPPPPGRMQTKPNPRLSQLQIAALFVAFVATWTLYFSITEAPFAVKHDMAEAYAWGREFQLGYNQHPPFWAWVCGAWFSVMPHTGWAFALLSASNAAIGLAGAWRLIGCFTDGPKRVAAWMLLLATPFYTFYAYKYDADTIFLSLWPWTLFYFLKSLRTCRLSDAVALGIMAGLALMSKYYALILVASCFLAGLQHPAWRCYIRSASPYVAALVTAIICGPHIVWLFANDAPPLHYLANRSGLGWGLIMDLASKTLFSSLGSSLGPVLVVAWIAWTARRPHLAPGNALRQPGGVLVTLAVTPLALTIIGALVLRTRTTPDMPVGTFPLVPLLIIQPIQPVDVERLARIAARLAVIVAMGAVALSPAIAAMRVWTSWTSTKTVEAAPFQEMAKAATRLWHEHTGLPLAYVGGTDWFENAVVFYSPDRPHAFVHFGYPRNLWVTPRDIAQHGLLSVCRIADRLCLAETAAFVTPRTTRSEITLAHRFLGRTAEPMQFVLTFIPPTVAPGAPLAAPPAISGAPPGTRAP